VRGTTRDPARCVEIEAAGAQCVLADPDRVGSMVAALEHVSVVVHLLGSAQGPSEQLAALHGPRLDMLLSRVTDSPVHAFVYEACGSVDPAVLAAGAQCVRAFSIRTRTRVELLDAEPSAPGAWLHTAVATVRTMLGER
jgi:uncharacterized protein YbjT (DUF2867 family)